MKICIIGGAGDMALGSLRDFLEQDEVESIVLADIDYGRLERLRDTLASPKVSIVVADASSAESVCTALDGANVGQVPMCGVSKSSAWSRPQAAGSALTSLSRAA